MNNNADLCWSELKRLKSRPIIHSPDNTPFIFKCKDCHGDGNYLVYDSRADETSCRSCGFVQPFNHTCFTGYNEYLPDTSVRISKSIYKQKDYLERKLDELACARIVVSEEIINQVVLELNGSEANLKNIKQILFKMGHKQKYLQIPTILYTLDPNKFPPIKLSCHQRIKVVNMFSSYIAVFDQINQKRRKNLLNYHFVLKQIFQFLKIKIYPHHFNLPKGRKTLENHEEIWKDICIFNKWL